jgi:hypothetical protein
MLTTGLLFGLIVFLGLFTQYFSDKKVFGRSAARKNFYYVVPYATISWFCINLLYMVGQNFTNRMIMHFFAFSCLTVVFLLPRIMIKSLIHQRMGSLILDIKKDLYLSDFVGVFFCSWALTLLLAIALIHDFFIWLAVFFIGIIPYILLAYLLDRAKLIDRIEFREQGIYGSYFAIRWDQIETYKWTLSNDSFGGNGFIFHLQHNSFWPISRHLELKFSSKDKDEITALLETHLPN